MTTSELVAHLRQEFELTTMSELAYFSCTEATLEQDADTRDGAIVIGAGEVLSSRRLYLLPRPSSAAEVPAAPNVVYYKEEAQTLPIYRAVYRLLAPERRLQEQLAQLDRTCLTGDVQALAEQASQYLGNPIAVVDTAFNTIAMAPHTPLGVDSWDRILRGEPVEAWDLQQAQKMIEQFQRRNLAAPQIIDYTEADGRTLRRIVAEATVPETGQAVGGLEVIELNRPFEPQDRVLVERVRQLICHYLNRPEAEERPVTPEEALLHDLLYCEPQQEEMMQRRLKLYEALTQPQSFYLATIQLSAAHQKTSANVRALLAQEYPEGWTVLEESVLGLLLPAQNTPDEENALVARLRQTGRKLNQTILLSMLFPSPMQLGSVWRFNAKAHEAAERRHCEPGCRTVAQMFHTVFLQAIAASTDLRMFIHPMLAELDAYDRAHDANLMRTLNVYLEEECDLNQTAQALYIHRNTLLYRLKRICAIARIDLDNRSVREVARIGCALWNFYHDPK
jgi:sugar diacid utilization regulator